MFISCCLFIPIPPFANVIFWHFRLMNSKEIQAVVLLDLKKNIFAQCDEHYIFRGHFDWKRVFVFRLVSTWWRSLYVSYDGKLVRWPLNAGWFRLELFPFGMMIQSMPCYSLWSCQRPRMSRLVMVPLQLWSLRAVSSTPHRAFWLKVRASRSYFLGKYVLFLWFSYCNDPAGHFCTTIAIIGENDKKNYLCVWFHLSAVLRRNILRN